MKKQFGERAKARPCRDFAIPAAGEVDLGPVTDDNLDVDIDVATEDRAVTEEEAGGVLR